MTAVEESPTTRRNPTWMVVAIAGGFGLFYAYIVWNSVGLLVSQATGPLGINAAGWALLLSAAVFPLLAFGAAFGVGYRRRAGQFALVLLTGLGLSAVFWFNVLAYAATKGAELLG